jgi:phospholipid/cholesterol/gamma-HCH transport system permease protein
MGRFTGYIGKKVAVFIDHMLKLHAFYYRTWMLILNMPKEGRAINRRAIVEQVYFTGVQALPVIIPLSLIVGSMLIIMFSRVSGQYDMGKMTLILLVREFGPMITAIVVILRSATAVTIEISYMNALNEIDAIEMAGIDPMRILCIPRLVGITSAILCLFIVFDLLSIVGGYSIVWVATHVPMGNLLGQIGKAITVTDIAVGLIKAVCFGFVITTICLYHGFKTKKRITNIPQVTSASAVECLFHCVVINIIISLVFYV